jgi:Restriction endonuclease
MTSSEYEEYVTKIVRQFDFCKHAKISNNRKFQGKRQPSEYEIDIAIEVRFSEAVDFLMIIECKFWNRPVDRPVIQSVAQTKDAISAHKAVVVTVQGFSKEAISVAEAHGIALDMDWDEYVDEGEDKYLLRDLHCATFNTILRDAYAQITSHEDWRQVDALGRLAQWEN